MYVILAEVALHSPLVMLNHICLGINRLLHLHQGLIILRKYALVVILIHAL